MKETREQMEADGWICTDPDCIQYMKVLGPRKFYFKEDRISDPMTGKTEVYCCEINLDDYTLEKTIEECSAFYPAEEITKWWNDESELALIAECIFEMSN